MSDRTIRSQFSIKIYQIQKNIEEQFFDFLSNIEEHSFIVIATGLEPRTT